MKNLSIHVLDGHKVFVENGCEQTRYEKCKRCCRVIDTPKLETSLVKCECKERDEARETRRGEGGCKKHLTVSTNMVCQNCSSSIGAGTGCFECSNHPPSSWSAQDALYTIHENGLLSVIYERCFWCRDDPPPPPKKTYAQVVKECKKLNCE